MDSEINVPVGPEVQSFPFLKLLAELRNRVHEEFLLKSDLKSDMLVFHHYTPRKLVHAHSSPATVTYQFWPQTRQMRFKAAPILLAKMSHIPHGLRCL